MADIIMIIICLALVAATFVTVYRTMKEIDKVGWKKVDSYDERQILSRGKAFQAGFLVSFCLCLIFAILANIFDGIKAFAPNFLFIAAFAGITVFAIIAIWTDSFTNDKFQAKKFFTLYFIIGAVNLAAWIMNRDWHTAGEFLASENLFGFLIGISFMIIAIIIAVKTVREQHEEDK